MVIYRKELQGITKRTAYLKTSKLLKLTRTRTFPGTLLRLMDMEDTELTWLTNHCGHTGEVHFQWYQKEDTTLKLTKLAKVHLPVDDGKSVKNESINQMSTVEQEHVISCCNRTNTLEKV